MLWTTVVFVALTAVFVAWHVRRGRGGSAAPETSPRCPRCRVRIPAGASVCPSCGAPPQVYELVAAPVADAAPGGEAAGRSHAMVRADVCVGCGTCAAACPEPGALTVIDHRAVVDTAKCQAHGKCVGACPVGAIFLGTGSAVQRVEVPQVDFDFETNVPGVFIVGELGGRGLIKNAVNEGKVAAAAVARRTREAADRRNALIHDVVIVGAGPAGLSAGLEAMRQGLRAVVLEQGEPGESIRRYPRHKLLLAEPVQMPLYGDLWIADAEKERLLQVWEDVIAGTGIDVRSGHRVDGIRRAAWGFHVDTGSTTFPARYVVLAMGRRGTPRKLEVPGENLMKVVYDIMEMETFRGRRVLVAGGGDSAVESALGLARQPGTEVVLVHRGDDFPRVKERNLEKLRAAAAAKSVRVALSTRVLEILPASVRLATPSGDVEIPNDDVIVRVGGEPPTAFLDRVGVRRVVKELKPVDVPGAAAS